MPTIERKRVFVLDHEKVKVKLAQAGEEQRDHFWAFRQAMHPGMHHAWWQRDVSHHLVLFWNDLRAGLRPKLVLQAPPQHGKTEQLADFIAWASGKDPNIKTIFASYSDDLGMRVNLDVQRIMDSPAYQVPFANTQLSNEHNHAAGRYLRNLNLLEFVGYRGSFRCTTVGGQINGQGLHLGIIDDPIKGRAEAQSETIRNKTWNWLTDDFFGRFADDAGLIMIMTRWHVDDPIGRWRDKFPETKIIRYSALADDFVTEDAQGKKIRMRDWTVGAGFRKVGEPLMPEHKSYDFLMERKKLLTKAGWESIYQQHPIVVGGDMFPVDKIEVIQSTPRSEVKRSIRYWDKAATEDGGAYTAGTLMHELHNGKFVIESCVSGQWNVDTREARIMQTAASDKATYRSITIWVEQEPGSGGKESAEASIRRLRGYRVFADKVTGDKVVRAEPYAAQVQGGNVQIVAGEWNRDFLEEHEQFPSGRRKDRVDASAGAFNKLTAAGTYDTSMRWVTHTDGVRDAR